jgi:hypothetical protein
LTAGNGRTIIKHERVVMKRALIFLAVMGLAASLGAQSLVDLAKREKERRESFRGRHAVVIKNLDLLLVKKATAVEVTIPEGGAGENLQPGDQSAPATDVTGEAGLVTPPSGSEAGSEPPATGENVSEDITEGSGPLEDQLKRVDALVEDLTTEMNSLRQQYEAQNTMVPGYVIQQQLEETNQRLVRAQNRQTAIRTKMEKQGLPIKKDPGSGGR